MILSETGKIGPDLYMLGYASVPVYLLDGDAPAVFDAGFCYLGKCYADAIREVLGGRQLAYCFLSHSHFDHCGAVAVLKRRFPPMKVVASPRASATLKRPNALALIDRLSRGSLDMIRRNAMDFQAQDHFRPFTVDIKARDGDCFRVSDRATVQVIDTPGHTRDCISFYIPQARVLICSEAAGIADPTGYIVSDCLVDYDMYRTSMEKLAGLQAKVVCLGHRYAFTGEDAERYLSRAMAFCRDFRDRVVRCWQEEQGDTARVLARLKSFEYDGKPEPKQPEAAYVINLEARVRAVLKHLQKGDPAGKETDAGRLPAGPQP